MSIDLTPLNDLGSAKYLGFAGGLYPDGKKRASLCLRVGRSSAWRDRATARQRRQTVVLRKDRHDVHRDVQHIPRVFAVHLVGRG
jgi:hypothetical protein